MPEMIQWQKRCLECGRVETSTVGKQKPSGTPTMLGKCPNTTSGKHNPVYEQK